MRGWSWIKAFVTNPASGADADIVNGVDVTIGGSTKRALLFAGGKLSLADIVAFLMGTMPDVNWDEIDATSGAASEVISFYYKGSQEFDVVVTNGMGDFNISLVDYSPFGLIDESATYGTIDGTANIGTI